MDYDGNNEQGLRVDIIIISRKEIRFEMLCISEKGSLVLFITSFHTKYLPCTLIVSTASSRSIIKKTKKNWQISTPKIN